MRRRELLLGCTLMVLIAASFAALAQVDPDVLVFYREGCHDCERMDRVIEELHGENPTLSVRRIEEGSPDGELMWGLSAEYGIFPTKFPVIFVGDEAIVGIGFDKELQLRAAVEACMEAGCVSPLVRITGPRIPWRAYIVAGLIAAFLLMIFIDYAI
ncbi:MAG: thioredoxin family protein [Candidatus Bipolaricaulia bacterium]